MSRMLDMLTALGVLPSTEKVVDYAKKGIRVATLTPGAIVMILDDDFILHVFAHLITKEKWPETRAALVREKLQTEADIALVEEKARARCDGKCVMVML